MGRRCGECEYVYAIDGEIEVGVGLPSDGFFERIADESGTFDGVAVYGRKLAQWEERQFCLLYLGKILKKP